MLLSAQWKDFFDVVKAMLSTARDYGASDQITKAEA
jgi:sulfite reductase beta subunit-like hemoprotein